MNRWSKWRSFKEKESALNEIPEEPGIYQFRSVKKGIPIKIQRLKKNDEKGILSIGESGNLKKRIKAFWYSLKNKDYSSHAAAWHYLSFGFDKNFPAHSLEFRYKKSGTKSKAIKEECIELLRYRNKFMDGPPLNISRGKYPPSYEKIFKQITGRELLG
ncbi:MAG: hypothetical protein HY889_03860 [Deltaproteobacteria bacterium]|nr:hypothetical protein [Deltaproteobacteria bacterium]